MRVGDRGFTLLETMIASVFGICAFGSCLGLWGASDKLSTTSQAAMRAESEHRRNLAAVASVLRDVPAETFQNLDPQGRSANPRFRRVVGLDGTAVLMGPTTGLVWIAHTPTTVIQGARLGDVRLQDGAQDVFLARNVPEGAFEISVAGRIVTILLTTVWQADREKTPRTLSGRLEVCLRN